MIFTKLEKKEFYYLKRVHPMLLTRGVPGTHDINLMLSFFKKMKSKKFKSLKLPSFNKAVDDRSIKKNWQSIKEKPDVIIFEGWCVGAKPVSNKSLKRSINSMEKVKDSKFDLEKICKPTIEIKIQKPIFST